MKPKLSSKTPDAIESNALIELHDELRDNFRRRGGQKRYIGLIEFTIPSMLEKADGDVQANVVIQHLEVVTNENTHAAEIDRLFTRVWQGRTGASGPRPADGEDTTTELDGFDDEDDDED